MAYMEVLLSEDVDNLGHRGQVVRVRAGYGRNYLLPQKLAVEATPGNKKMIESHRRVLAKREDRERTAAANEADKLSGLELIFDRRVGEHGILYGSVTTMDIAQALSQHGFTIERRRIGLREPIKEVGQYEVAVKLHREVAPAIKLVVRKEGAAQAAAPGDAPQAEQQPGEADSPVVEPDVTAPAPEEEA
ncbi:MAG TPA: 50S ribosomal protein L9 [Blastocatellia bacterium]|nr:50S ribosomal protein L9 [Blastocatellia bacterium]